MKKLIAALCAYSLAACASASNPGAMVAELSQETIITDSSKLRENVTVGDIGGGKETNPLWVSNVSSEDFSEALRQSLSAHAMLATESNNYRLDAELVKLKQPLFGMDMTVTSTVDYTLTDVNTGEVVLQKTVEHAYTAKLGDAFVAVKRLQLANEGSIKGNISELIKEMIATVDSEVPTKAVDPESLEGAPSGVSS